MEKTVSRKINSESPAIQQIAEWLAEAGITVEQVEDGPDLCSVCHSSQMHVAA